jgi:hypothetical protein
MDPSLSAQLSVHITEDDQLHWFISPENIHGAYPAKASSTSGLLYVSPTIMDDNGCGSTLAATQAIKVSEDTPPEALQSST